MSDPTDKLMAGALAALAGAAVVAILGLVIALFWGMHLEREAVSQCLADGHAPEACAELTKIF